MALDWTATTAAPRFIRSAATSPQRASMCFTYGQCGQRKATTSAGAPAASSVDQVMASGPDRLNEGSGEPSGSIVDGVATMAVFYPHPTTLRRFVTLGATNRRNFDSVGGR